jgi:hypothetical protein
MLSPAQIIKLSEWAFFSRPKLLYISDLDKSSNKVFHDFCDNKEY